MKKTLIIFCTVISLGLFTACEDAEETIQNIDEQEELSEGKFLSECSSLGIEGVAGVSKRDEIEFLGNQTEITTTYYSTASCTKDSVIGEKQYEGEFLVEQRESEDGVDQGVIEFELQEAKLTPSNETLVTALNAINYCGVDTYAVDETQDLTDQSDLLICPFESMPANLTSVYFYETNDDILTLTDAPVVESENSELSIPEETLPVIQVFAEEYVKQ